MVPGLPRQRRTLVKTLRILVAADVSPYTVLGGAERILREHTVRLVKRGHRVHLLVREVGGRGVREGMIDGVSISSYPVDPSGSLRFALASILRARWLFQKLHGRERFKLLNLHQPFSALGLLTSPATRGLPTVYTFLSPAFLEFRIRRGLTGRRPLRQLPAALLKRIEQTCFRKADRIVVLSRFSRDLLKQHYGIEGEKIVVIPGGVDLRHFAPNGEKKRFKTELGCPPDAFLLLTIRNLVPRMGLDALLHAMREVQKVAKGVTLLIGGEGPMEQDLKGLAKRLGLVTSVRFEGYIPEEQLTTYYQAADFFILPTKELEGFGLVAVEALACGTPVLGTPVGAIPEILGALQADLLFEGTDPQAIAKGILTHLRRAQADPESYKALRTRCRTYASAHFGWEAIIDLLEQEFVTVALGDKGQNGSR